jgi:catechol 2,3-dioxygenase-like lactoylglutathione lyase family enzyme
MAKTRLGHVGIIIPDMEQVEHLLELLGLEKGHTQYVDEYQADCVFTKGPGAVIEFIVPRGGKLAQFNKGIGGLHHIALEVDDLDAVTQDLKARDVDLLEETPVDAGSIWINFMPPAYTRGFTVELIETKKATQK